MQRHFVLVFIFFPLLEEAYKRTKILLFTLANFWLLKKTKIIRKYKINERNNDYSELFNYSSTDIALSPKIFLLSIGRKRATETEKANEDTNRRWEGMGMWIGVRVVRWSEVRGTSPLSLNIFSISLSKLFAYKIQVDLSLSLLLSLLCWPPSGSYFVSWFELN